MIDPCTKQYLRKDHKNDLHPYKTLGEVQQMVPQMQELRKIALYRKL